MSQNRYTVISGTGCYIPERIVRNNDFLENKFFNQNGERLTKSNSEITSKLEEITGIKERRYVTDDLVTSDIAYFAAREAINSSGIDKETLDFIIVAHNFGDVRADNRRSDFVPSIAARVKNSLEIINPKTVCYDLAFGCPGWLEGVIQGNSFIKSKIANRILVIGSETLSRISDPSDIDSMIYSDGAGAAILEAVESNEPVGIITHEVRSDTKEHARLLWMTKSYDPEFKGSDLFLKMNGHKLYKYALQTVPGVVKESLDNANVHLEDVKKVFIHQANEKMDEEILNRIFALYDVTDSVSEKVKQVMPMTISWLGNSSVATLPTLFDLFQKGKLDDHKPVSGEFYVFASVGAGMNVNSMVYKMP